MPLAMLKFAAQEHGAGHSMRFLVSALAWLATLAIADGEPMLTISCDKPTGFNIAYGTSFKERLEASEKKQPEPPPALTGPNEDGYLGKPTFIIDSNRKKMTVIWAELPEDVELRKQAKQFNMPMMPPPPAADGAVVLFFQEQISAVQVEPWSIMTYSFFPTIGTAFIGQQWMQPGSKSTRQLATFARCEFSWTNPR
jgi:hypothetical protein